MAFGSAALPVTALVAVVLATAMPAVSPSAEEVPAAVQAPPPVGEKRGELARLQDEIKLSDEVVQRLETQIRALDADRAKLAQELIDTAAKSRETEGKALE